MAPIDYRMACSIARAFEVLGERWTPLIFRELLICPLRFKELQERLRGISTNLLTERLRMLEAGGFLERTGSSPQTYRLTPRGEGAREGLLALARWGLTLLEPPRTGDLFHPSWAILAMEATFRTEPSKGIRESYAYEVDGVAFYARVDDGTLQMNLGEVADPAMCVRTDTRTFLKLGWRQTDLDTAIASGHLQLEGSREAFERSLAMFVVPTGDQTSA